MENKPKLIRTWNELKECTSETHTLEIDLDGHSGWIRNKENNKGDYEYYLSTHTFYGSTYKHSTEILQNYGFNVQLANWDEM